MDYGKEKSRKEKRIMVGWKEKEKRKDTKEGSRKEE